MVFADHDWSETEPPEIYKIDILHKAACKQLGLWPPPDIILFSYTYV